MNDSSEATFEGTGPLANPDVLEGASADSGADDDDAGSVASDAEPPFAYGSDDDEAAATVEPSEAAANPVAPTPAPAYIPDPFSWNAPRRDPGPIEVVPRVSHQKHRICAREHACGGPGRTALSLWQLFLPATLFQLIADRTSIRLVRHGWSAVSVPELYCWFAILITMGIRQLPATTSYWSRDSFGKSEQKRAFCAQLSETL